MIKALTPGNNRVLPLPLPQANPNVLCVLFFSVAPLDAQLAAGQSGDRKQNPRRHRILSQQQWQQQPTRPGLRPFGGDGRG